MIAGIGIDIVAIARLEGLYLRHGQRAVDRLLSTGERDEFMVTKCPSRFLAKRFAAKEAFAKAMGTGLIPPVTLSSIGVAHDCRGRPFFTYQQALEDYVAERGLVAHLSISDERDFAVAFVVLERK